MSLPLEILARSISELEALTRPGGIQAYNEEVPLQAWKDELGRLRVWTANVDSETSLQDAPHIREQIIRLFLSLGELVNDLTELHKSNRDDAGHAQAKDGESDTEGQTEIQEIYQSLVHLVSDLNRMTMVMRAPAHGVPTATQQLDRPRSFASYLASRKLPTTPSGTTDTRGSDQIGRFGLRTSTPGLWEIGTRNSLDEAARKVTYRRRGPSYTGEPKRNNKGSGVYQAGPKLPPREEPSIGFSLDLLRTQEANQKRATRLPTSQEEDAVTQDIQAERTKQRALEDELDDIETQLDRMGEQIRDLEQKRNDTDGELHLVKGRIKALNEQRMHQAHQKATSGRGRPGDRHVSQSTRSDDKRQHPITEAGDSEVDASQDTAGSVNEPLTQRPPE